MSCFFLLHNALFLLTSFLILGASTTPGTNQEEHGDIQSASVQRNTGESSVNQTTSRRPDASIAGEPGVRVVPIRTMVAAVPVLGRFQSSVNTNNEQGSQPASQQHAAPHSTAEFTLHRQSMEDSARNGNLTNEHLTFHTDRLRFCFD